MEKTFTLDSLKVICGNYFFLKLTKKKAVVIGHKQDKEHNSLLFIIQISHPFQEYKKRSTTYKL